VKDASNLIRIPESLPLDLAAILPCRALAAYSAVQLVRPFIQEKLENSTGSVWFLIGNTERHLPYGIRCNSLPAPMVG